MADILIVEDEFDLAETYADLLTAHGHKPRLTTTVAEAIRQIRQKHPEVIILDLSLPDNSGAVLIRHIWEHKLRNIRLIVISGHSEMVPQGNFMDAADLVLNKPISNDQLLTLIERVLRRVSTSNV